MIMMFLPKGIVEEMDKIRANWMVKGKKIDMVHFKFH